jgi:hypothetical protein
MHSNISFSHLGLEAVPLYGGQFPYDIAMNVAYQPFQLLGCDGIIRTRSLKRA